jgi:uncharacterized protein (TIGR02678 family)
MIEPITRPSSRAASHPASAVSAGLNIQMAEERKQAVMGLLRRPLLAAQGDGAEVFALVRRHGAWLKEWFARHSGWGLQIDSELARLRKTPGDRIQPARGLVDSKGEPFTRRRYVLLCLTLAVIERSERQTVLRRIADAVAGAFIQEPQFARNGLSFDLSLREHRRDLVEVVRHLMEKRILTRVDGDEQQYIAQEKTDVLYNINSAALAAALNVRRGPSTIQEERLEQRIAMMLEEPLPDTEDGRNRRIRTRLFRILLDDPILYFSKLDAEEIAYLASQRHFMLNQIESATTLVAEVRKEGIAMTDPDGDGTDVAMPEEGTDGHVTLLLAEYLARHLRQGIAEPLAIEAAQAHLRSLIGRHKTHWRKDASETGAEILLADRALKRLEALRLIQMDWSRQTIVPLPAIGRYGIEEAADVLETAPMSFDL